MQVHKTIHVCFSASFQDCSVNFQASQVASLIYPTQHPGLDMLEPPHGLGVRYLALNPRPFFLFDTFASGGGGGLVQHPPWHVETKCR